MILMSEKVETMEPAEIKSCCTTFYENEFIAKLMSENFHPGGEALTIHLGETMGLDENSFVLDVACGPGSSPIALAKKFGCRVVGVDLSEKNLDRAREKVEAEGLTDKIEFVISDAEKLQFEDETFDAVICECALCTFPDKKTAVSEMYRVLKPGGKVGITDVIIESELPEELNNVMSYVACISGALSAQGYQDLLKEGGFAEIGYEDQSHTVRVLMKKGKMMLKGSHIIKQICGCDFEKIFRITEDEARRMLKIGFEELDKGTFGYGLITGIK
jgi:ubiquinone/menaquinone biosynthesis C-methylase UbiE